MAFGGLFSNPLSLPFGAAGGFQVPLANQFSSMINVGSFIPGNLITQHEGQWLVTFQVSGTASVTSSINARVLFNGDPISALQMTLTATGGGPPVYLSATNVMFLPLGAVLGLWLYSSTTTTFTLSSGAGANISLVQVG